MAINNLIELFGGKHEDHADFKARFVTKIRGTIGSGIASEEFSFGGGSKWGNALAAGEDVKKAKDALAQASSIIGLSSTVGFIGGLSLATFRDTVSTYDGGDVPSFSLSLLNVNVDGTSPWGKVSGLLEGVYPRRLGSEGAATTQSSTLQTIASKIPLQRTPFDYHPLGIDDADGLVSVYVGKWFRALNFMIITSVKNSFSPQKDINGKPLIIVTTVGFKPFRLPTLEEARSWILM